MYIWHAKWSIGHYIKHSKCHYSEIDKRIDSCKLQCLKLETKPITIDTRTVSFRFNGLLISVSVHFSIRIAWAVFLLSVSHIEHCTMPLLWLMLLFVWQVNIWKYEAGKQRFNHEKVTAAPRTCHFVFGSKWKYQSFYRQTREKFLFCHWFMMHSVGDASFTNQWNCEMMKKKIRVNKILCFLFPNLYTHPVRVFFFFFG